MSRESAQADEANDFPYIISIDSATGDQRVAGP